MKSFIALLCLAAIVAGVLATADNEHPKYTVIMKKQGYEIRKYAVAAPQFWVETSANTTSFSAASNGAFQKLFGYISGKNSRNLKIDMTSPVTMHNDGQSLVMRFFISATLGSNVPTPTDPAVRIVSVQNDLVAAISFSGWASQSSWDSNTQNLKAMLARDGIALSQTGANRLAQYDSPWTIFNRLNEVWLPVQM